MSISLPSSSLRGLAVTFTALVDEEVEKSRCGFKEIFFGHGSVIVCKFASVVSGHRDW